MTHRPSPVSVSDLDTWRRATGASVSEARRRLVVFVILQALGDDSIQDRVVAKGGNALRYFYGSVRSTTDLDLSAVGEWTDDDKAIRSAFDAPIRAAGRRHGVKLKIQRVARNPKHGPGRTRPTYDVHVGYQFRGDRWFDEFEKRSVSEVVRIEISLNEVVCGRETFDLCGVHVVSSSLDDIVAEKLRALLQQPQRRRNRWQDVFDIASLIRSRPGDLDRGNIGRYLVEKSRARDLHPRKSSFDATVRELASAEYTQAAQSTGAAFIPFEDAWSDVLRLVSELPLPD